MAGAGAEGQKGRVSCYANTTLAHMHTVTSSWPQKMKQNWINKCPSIRFACTHSIYTNVFSFSALFHPAFMMCTSCFFFHCCCVCSLHCALHWPFSFNAHLCEIEILLWGLVIIIIDILLLFVCRNCRRVHTRTLRKYLNGKEFLTTIWSAYRRTVEPQRNV